MENISNLEKLEHMMREGALFILFGGKHCAVCNTLRPRLVSMLTDHFPHMQGVYIDCERSPEICAQHSVFNLPVVKVYIDGMLVAEDARAFSLVELMQRIERPYAMWHAESQ